MADPDDGVAGDARIAVFVAQRARGRTTGDGLRVEVPAPPTTHPAHGAAGQLVPPDEDLLLLAREAAPAREVHGDGEGCHVRAAFHPGRIADRCLDGHQTLGTTLPIAAVGVRAEIVDAVVDIDPASTVVPIEPAVHGDDLQRQAAIRNELPGLDHGPIDREFRLRDELDGEICLLGLMFGTGDPGELREVWAASIPDITAVSTPCEAAGSSSAAASPTRK